jgi:kojibiose phosphorylase
VVEDAAAGIEAALAAGMPALALGLAERFATEGLQHSHFARRDSLNGMTLAELEAMTQPVPTWTVTQEQFDPARQHHLETVFTLGSGYFASRGSFEEGYPGEVATTFAHGIYDKTPVVFTALVNLPGWFDLTLRVNGELFRLDQGTVLHFQRRLDMRQGVLQRQVRWQSPAGAVLDLLFERFISYARPQVGAWRLLVTAVNQACHLTLETGINGHVNNENGQAYLRHWQHVGQGQAEDGAIWLHSRTHESKIELGTAVSLQSTTEATATCQQCPGQPRFLLNHNLPPGESLQLDKLVSYAASRDAVANVADVQTRALAQLHGQDYDALKTAHAAAWAQLWQASDVLIEGDDEAQQAVRYNLFQLLSAAPQQDERASIGAKTLSGYGYSGHIFWDTEIFMLPFFSYTHPHLARNLLRYRYHVLPGARRKAAANGVAGAQYPWESAASGDEVTPTWVTHFSDPKKLVRIWTGDIQIHISADVAYASLQYWRVTGDDAFMRDYGAEMILDTARFWASRAEPEEVEGVRRYAIRDVIGPDEYHDHVDNNSFTNFMCRWHLQTALGIRAWLRQHHPQKAAELEQRLELSDAAYAHWQEVINQIIFLYNPESRVIEQFEGFFDLEPVDPAFIARAEKSLQVIFGIEGANERQILKQADVIMLLCLFRDQFDHDVWQANWERYMPITDHRYGSSLGPSFHAWAACEMDRPDEAYEHFMLACRADLHDVRGNAGDGLHAASLGGVWQAIVFGFAGLRLAENGPVLRPCLPAHWRRLAFHYWYQGQRRQVDIQRKGGGEKEVITLHE